jgi:riboflavin kinase/FMN adenylyltransferase
VPTVVTFDPHPLEFFTGESRQLLTPLGEKAQQLEKLGIQQLILLPFDRELAALTPQDFVEKILIHQLQAQKISVGQDFCFGHQRRGTAEDLQNLASAWGSQVIINPLKTLPREESVRISSSRIRQALAAGELEKVTQMLGRFYLLQGKVILGQQLGQTIGFPTANLEISPDKLLPRSGVYAVKAYLENALVLDGVVNIGHRPTVGGKSVTVEVHLLNWSGNLYGQTLEVHLIKFLRPEQKFPSLDALKAQINQDCHQAQEILGTCL